VRATRPAGERSRIRENGSPQVRLHLWVTREPRLRIDMVYESLVRDIFELLQWSFELHFRIFFVKNHILKFGVFIEDSPLDRSQQNLLPHLKPIEDGVEQFQQCPRVAPKSSCLPRFVLLVAFTPVERKPMTHLNLLVVMGREERSH
jgi:hypothetical protein